MKIAKRIRPLLDIAERLGFQASLTRRNHLRFSRPGCVTVYAPGTPSDYRSVANTAAQLKRARRGLPV